MYKFIHLFSLAFFILVIALLYIITQTRLSNQSPTIYGIMITGKDIMRLQYAKLSLHNFFEQEYSNKRLIIVNHHANLVVIPSSVKDRVIQIQVNKSKFTLGAMRNLALDLVPNNAFWTTWDDDDYRPPCYLRTLYKCITLNQERYNAVTFTHRFEYNVKTNFVWGFSMKQGFGYACMLCKKDPRFKYLDTDTFEDRDIKAFYAPTLYVFENKDKMMYIRLVHNNNTSKFVDQNKHLNTQLNFGEYNVSAEETELVQSIMSPFFQIVL